MLDHDEAAGCYGPWSQANPGPDDSEATFHFGAGKTLLTRPYVPTPRSTKSPLASFSSSISEGSMVIALSTLDP